MEQITDWPALWDELVDLQDDPSEERTDRWRDRAAGYDQMVKRRSGRAEPLMDFVAGRLRPTDTVLDIGAGTGRWAIRLAGHAASVTALEPSPAMLEVLRGNLAQAQVSNVQVLEGRWPEAEVSVHDVTLCSHSMYGSPNLPGFIRRMLAVSRRTCYLALRCPKPEGVMAEAARQVLGQPHDSPNFVVAYNILLGMGLFPNVLFNHEPWGPWSHDSLAEALTETKRRLRLPNSPTTHDPYLLDLLQRRLQLRDGRYHWPEGTRSALVYWDVATP